MGNYSHNKILLCFCCFKEKNDPTTNSQQETVNKTDLKDYENPANSEITFEELNQKIETKQRLEQVNNDLKNHLKEFEKQNHIETLNSLQEKLESKNNKIKDLKQLKDNIEKELKDNQIKLDNFVNNQIPKKNLNHSSNSSGQFSKNPLSNKSDSFINKDKFNPANYIAELQENIRTEKNNCIRIQTENSELAKEFKALHIEHEQIDKEYNLALKLLSEEKSASNYFQAKAESLSPEIIYNSELQALQSQKAILVHNLNELKPLLIKSQKDLQYYKDDSKELEYQRKIAKLTKKINTLYSQ